MTASFDVTLSQNFAHYEGHFSSLIIKCLNFDRPGTELDVDFLVKTVKKALPAV